MSLLLPAGGHAFITLFDRFYMARGLLMARSLLAHLPGARLYVVCLDHDCERMLSAVRPDGMELIPLAALEAFDARLPEAQSNRSRIEYYFTLSPALPRFLFATQSDLTRVTYLDADLLFHADPTPALQPVATATIAAIEHRFSPLWDGSREYGRFNVGWLTFRRDVQAIECLERWQQQCLDYCPDEPDPAAGAYGDQLYLDEWPGRYDGFAVIDHPGANLAPWNVRTHRLVQDADGVHVDGQPLLFFHFHGLKRKDRGIWDTSLEVFGTRLDKLLGNALYRPYLRALEAEMARVNEWFGSPVESTVRSRDIAARPDWLLRLKFLKRAFKGQYIRL